MSGRALSGSLTLLAGLLLAGCGAVAPAPTVTPVPATAVIAARTPGLSNIDAADLALARQLWQADPARPRYRLELALAGLAADDGIAVLEVVNGQVRRASRLDGGSVPPGVTALTVDRLLGLVEESLAAVAAGRIERLEVTFDGHSGVPIEIRISESTARPQPRHYIVRSYSSLID